MTADVVNFALMKARLNIWIFLLFVAAPFERPRTLYPFRLCGKRFQSKYDSANATVRTPWNQWVVQLLAMSHIEVSPASVLAELDKMLTSPAFSSAARPSRLLRFLVQETIDGRGDSLKEYTLGTSVLGRPPSFDPRTSTIARFKASR